MSSLYGPLALSFQDDEGESSPAGTARCRHGRVSPSLLPLGREEGGGEVLGGVDVVLGPRGGCLSGIEHVSTGHSHEQWGDGESHGAIPAHPHLLRPPGGLKLHVGARV